MITRHIFWFQSSDYYEVSDLEIVKIFFLLKGYQNPIFWNKKDLKDGSAKRECKFCGLPGHVCGDIQRHADGKADSCKFLCWRFARFCALYIICKNIESLLRFSTCNHLRYLGVYSSVHNLGRFPRVCHVHVFTHSHWKFGEDCFWERLSDQAMWVYGFCRVFGYELLF